MTRIAAGSGVRSSVAYARLFRNRNLVALWLGRMVSFIGDDFNWLAVPGLKRGRVGSALNALSAAAGLLSVATAAALGELVGPRTVYVVCGLIIARAGLLGSFVLQESTPVESRT